MAPGKSRNRLLGGGGVSKLSLGEVIDNLSIDSLLNYGRTDGSLELKTQIIDGIRI